jgi:3,4-dihydroxy-2-butanone 4-phosphate synthase
MFNRKAVKMESISDIKIDLINLITKISDYKRLKFIYSVVQSELDTPRISSPQEITVDKFELGKVDIRKGVTKDQIFEEQGNKSMTFQEVQELMTDEPWEQSIDELLATLD